MLATTHKSQIDALWLAFHSGGVTNPISVIEQISYLMFLRLLDLTEDKQENRARRLNRPFEGHYFTRDQQDLRWSSFRHLGGDRMLPLVRDRAFAFLREDVRRVSKLGDFLRNANCLIPSGSLMVTAVNAVDELPLTEADAKGDLYEYLLSKLSTAGIAGQFRTPRHIIRAMIEIIDPQPTDSICDPACGTAGFLVGVMEYLLEKYSTPSTATDGTPSYLGDLLEPYRDHIQNGLLHGYDFDQTMLRIAAMNLLLHGIESPAIVQQDTLGSSFSERRPTEARDRFSIIFANPPFKGQLDEENIDPSLRTHVKTKKSELLFLVLMLRMLQSGGRCAVIVPDGVLFGSSRAHTGVRELLLDQNQLEAVISLPAGVFKPYAGVSTAILIFTKGGSTDRVWFYDVQADGFSLDDKRTPLPAHNDLPDLVKAWKLSRTANPSEMGERTAKSFFVPVADIRANNCDLSLNRYKQTIHPEVSFDPPGVILQRLKSLEHEILNDIQSLEGMLK
jgi:type I restriction enzyme M protein